MPSKPVKPSISESDEAKWEDQSQPQQRIKENEEIDGDGDDGDDDSDREDVGDLVNPVEEYELDYLDRAQIKAELEKEKTERFVMSEKGMNKVNH